MVCKVKTATLSGVEANTVLVEADISDGLPSFDMVGLLSSEVKESRERTKTALKNSGFTIPPSRITINLAPADMRKSGTYFDLPIAVAILVGIGIVDDTLIKDSLFAGELGLDGSVVRVKGILPIVLAAKEIGVKRCFVPKDNLAECNIVDGITVVGVENISRLVYMLVENEYDENICPGGDGECVYDYDFADVIGQETAKRGALIMAAGRHNMLMIGAPGAGKSMIAKCIPSILPDMSFSEKLEVAKIQSVAGILSDSRYTKRPFRSPHHTVTSTALTGGGLNPSPGEITLSHRGVLFLDELTEFARRNIEVLRQPMEEKRLLISRVGGKYEFPADFIFLAASNPCRCGYYPDRNRCSCNENDVKKYLEKISGPIMDRIDICIRINPIKFEDIAKGRQKEFKDKPESSAEMRKRVNLAADIQRERYSKLKINFNGELDGRNVNEFCPLGKKESSMMEKAFDRLGLSARGYFKVLKVARTLADLEEKKNIECMHLAEALSLRTFS